MPLALLATRGSIGAVVLVAGLAACLAPPVAQRSETTVELYSPSQVLLGLPEPRRAWTVADRLRSPVFDASGERILFRANGSGELRVLDLPTGREHSIDTSGPDEGSTAFWLPDGRVLLTGRSVSVVSPGDPARKLADIPSESVAVARDASEVALWSRADGLIRVLDLATGSARTFPETYRGCGAEDAVAMAWSANGSQIAVSDCARGDESLLTVILDADSGERSRSLGYGRVALWAPDGAIFHHGGPSPTDYTVLVRSAPDHSNLRFAGGVPSPDGTYVVQRMALPTSDPSAERVFKAVLVDVATSASVVVREGISEVGWTGGGELYVIATDGSRIDRRE